MEGRRGVGRRRRRRRKRKEEEEEEGAREESKLAEQIGRILLDVGLHRDDKSKSVQECVLNWLLNSLDHDGW